MITLAIASLLIRGGERISRLGTGQRPARGRAVLTRLAAELTAADAPDAGLPRLEQIRRHSRIVMAGDFLSPIHEIEPVVRGFARQGIAGHLVQICDPAEEALPFTGRTRFEGLEGEGSALIGRADAIREDYESLRGAHRDALSDLCRSTGWTLTVNRTDRPAEPTLLTLFMLMSETDRI